MEELLEERLRLARERIADMKAEETRPDFAEYFQKTAGWFARLFETKALLEEGALFTMEPEKLEEWNRSCYEELYPENYGVSYANPAYAVKQLGREYGQLFSALYAEFRQALVSVYEDRQEEFAAAAELFLETQAAFRLAWEEEKTVPAWEEIRQMFYWYTSDYAEIRSERQIREKVTPEKGRLYRLVTESNLADPLYLYRYGKAVTENEKRTALFLNSLPEDTIRLMADTFTEGYRLGFLAGNKDIGKKKSVSIHYHMGFERVVKRAVENFAAMGLESILCAETCEGTPVNRQYLYDHKDDAALVFDRQYANRKLETVRCAFEKNREAAGVYGGPAVMEVFGEEPFVPVPGAETVKGGEKYRKLMVEYTSAYRQIQAEYIKEEERSFTIIAFPTPAIGEPFAEIFSEIIRINTLDYQRYRQMQQVLIDILDTAEYVEIKGMNGNRTNLRVMLRPLADPGKETKFENCVADVNIPVGEVFTSPVLAGTEGRLHVSRVFLNELEYRDLEITWKDGMTTDYSCGNFEDREEGRRYIRDNVLFHHEALPMGEFAIGTNTTAYVAARRYGIGDRLPILIAEKMGPHFALGDTCYAQAEDVKVYNPDGKEIVARDNEISALRDTDRSRAYFNCHTDITIPYDELGELTAVREDGSRVKIIWEGRFVPEGCEELNRPLLKEF